MTLLCSKKGRHETESAIAFTVGWYYPVPHVQLIKSFWGLHANSFLPVIGPLHDDREIIGFADQHWHIDFRFLNVRLWNAWGRGRRGRLNVFGRVVSLKNTTAAVTSRVVRCKRAMPVFPTVVSSPWSTKTDLQTVSWLKPLEDAFAAHRIKTSCATCPHRGVPLTGLPVNKDGVIVCPGHGLAWNATTGELVRRAKDGAS